jgi:hypothetical protein
MQESWFAMITIRSATCALVAALATIGLAALNAAQSESNLIPVWPSMITSK